MSPEPVEVGADPWWRAIPWIVLVLALSGSLFVAWRTPAFQGPDEGAHAFKAAAPTLGYWIARRETVGGQIAGGGPIDRALADCYGVYTPLAFHPERKLRADDNLRGKGCAWDGRRTTIGYPNTAIYSPLLYLPASLGFALGKAIPLRIVDTLRLARGLGALASVLVGVLALAAARSARPVLAILLVLPMTLFLDGVISQDGLMIALSALGAMLASRGGAQGRPATSAELWGASAAFALVGLAKPPYALFSLVLFFVEGGSRTRRALASLLPFLAALAWAAWMQCSVATRVSPDPGVDVHGQAMYLARHLGHIAPIAFTTLRLYGKIYCLQFVGVLGWLDTGLSRTFYRLAAATLLAGLGLALALPRRLLGRIGFRSAVLAVGAAVCAGFFFATYLTWNSVGAQRIDGVQGRYFLPVAVFLCAALEAGPARAGRYGVLAPRAAAVVVAVFGLLSAGTVIQAIMARYFG